MSEFSLWLYANYIRPRLSDAEKGDYDFHFDLVKNDLTPAGQRSLERCLEFTAIHAFLLGLRTGNGLAHSMARQ